MNPFNRDPEYTRLIQGIELDTQRHRKMLNQRVEETLIATKPTT